MKKTYVVRRIESLGTDFEAYLEMLQSRLANLEKTLASKSDSEELAQMHELRGIAISRIAALTNFTGVDTEALADLDEAQVHDLRSLGLELTEMKDELGKLLS